MNLRRRRADAESDHIATVERAQSVLHDAEALLREYEALLQQLRQATKNGERHGKR